MDGGGKSLQPDRLGHGGTIVIFLGPTVFQGDAEVVTNDDWGDATKLAAAAVTVGAFALDSGSQDAAVLVTLDPGAYTVKVSGVDGATGVALVEIYEVP